MSSSSYYSLLLLSLACLAGAQSAGGGSDSLAQKVNITALTSRLKMKLTWGTLSPAPERFVVQYNEKNVSTADNKTTLTDLRPSTNYTVAVFACAAQNCSRIAGPNVYRTKMDIPGRVENIQLSRSNATHLALTWDPPKVVAGLNQFYRVRVQDNAMDYATELNTTQTFVNVPEPKCNNGGYAAYHKVFINMFAADDGTGAGSAPQHKGNLSSPVIIYVDCLRALSKDVQPEDDFKLSKMVLSKTTIKLWWSVPKMSANNITGYVVTYGNDKTSRNKSVDGGQTTEVTLSDLQPDTAYNLTVSACVDDNCTAFVTPTQTVRTKPGIPDRVQQFRVSQMDATNYLVSWSGPPTSDNQKLKFRVRVSQSHGSEELPAQTADIAGTEYPISMAGCSNASYVIAVAAVDEVREFVGEWTNATLFASCARVEVQPRRLPLVKRIDATGTSISIGWEGTASTEIGSPSPDKEAVATAAVGINYRAEVDGLPPLTVTAPQVELRNLTAATGYSVRLLECVGAACTPFFGPTELRTNAAAAVITVRNVSLLELNATHLVVGWQPPPPSVNVPPVWYECEIWEGNVSRRAFRTNETRSFLPKLDCASASENVVGPSNLYYTISVTVDVVAPESELAGAERPSYIAEPASITASAPCLPPIQAVFTKIETNATSVSLEWTHVGRAGRDLSYTVGHNTSFSRLAEPHFTVYDLQPSTVYNFSVSVCEENEKCYPPIGGNKSLILRTEAEKARATNVTFIELDDLGYTRVSWQPYPANASLLYEVQVTRNGSVASGKSLDTFYLLPVAECQSDNAVIPFAVTITPIDLSTGAVGLPVETSVQLRCVSKPRLTRVEVSSDSVTLAWTDIPPTSKYAAEFSYYLVKYNEFGVKSTNATVTIEKLQPNLEYRVEVLTCGSRDCSRLIDPFGVRSLAPAPAPSYRVENATIDAANATHVLVSWTSCSPPSPSTPLPCLANPCLCGGGGGDEDFGYEVRVETDEGNSSPCSVRTNSTRVWLRTTWCGESANSSQMYKINVRVNGVRRVTVPEMTFGEEWSAPDASPIDVGAWSTVLAKCPQPPDNPEAHSHCLTTPAAICVVIAACILSVLIAASVCICRRFSYNFSPRKAEA